MFTVAEIMTREPYTLGQDDTLLDARKLMAEHHIRHVPIVRPDGNLIGLVSQRDVLAVANSRLFSEQAGVDSRELYVKLASIMTSPVHSVDENASLRGTALHLQKNKLGCLPVVRDNKLVGIITDADFVAVAINLMEQLAMVSPDEEEPMEGEDIDEFTDARGTLDEQR